MIDDTLVHLIESVADAQDFFTWLSSKKRVAIDTETTGLSPETDTVRLVQVGDSHAGWVIRANQWGGVVHQMVQTYEGEYIGHNIKFDQAMLRSSMKIELPTHRCHDTRALAHVLEPTLSSALKNVASRHVDARASVMDKQLASSFRQGGWTWATVPDDFEPYWAYAAVDTILTSRVFDILKPRVDALAPKAYELELAAAWVLERMERNGVQVDLTRTTEARDKINQYVGKVSSWCVDTYGVKPGANADVIRVLTDAGFQFDKATASGALSLDKEVLENIDHPLAQAVLTRRQLQKVGSTYLNNFIDLAVNGRLHPHINPMGARTGRMSMSVPNMQNLPRGATPVAKVVRDCIIARDGNMLISCDFDQIEMRVMAHLAQDKALRDAFAGDVDFFTAMARDLYHDQTLIKSDVRRQRTKNVGYAKIYGAGPEQLARTAGITASEAHALVQSFDMTYPGVQHLQRLVYDTAMQRREDEGIAYVTSPLTGRRHPADDNKEYALVNYLIQGMAAEVFKMKLIELDAAGLGPYMVMPVHDECVFECPTEDVAEHLHTIESVMNDQKLLSVPITATALTGDRWGSIKK